VRLNDDDGFRKSDENAVSFAEGLRTRVDVVFEGPNHPARGARSNIGKELAMPRRIAAIAASAGNDPRRSVGFHCALVGGGIDTERAARDDRDARLHECLREIGGECCCSSDRISRTNDGDTPTALQRAAYSQVGKRRQEAQFVGIFGVAWSEEHGE